MGKTTFDSRIPLLSAGIRLLGGQIRRTRSRCGKLAISTVLAGVVVALCAAAAFSASPESSEGPVVQLAERLEAPGQPALVSLYSTELDTRAAEGSEVGFEMEGVIRRLPCALRDYRFITTRASINDSTASRYEAEIHMVSASLPAGIRCGSPLPASIAEDTAKVKIWQIAAEKSGLTRYSGGPITLESLTNCATLDDLCPGRYMLTASLEGSGRPLRFVYTFAVEMTATRETGVSPPQAQQCPVP